MRLHLLGHSFGCRVVCAALEQLHKDGISAPPSVTVDVVLLEAAFDNDDLESEGLYADVPTQSVRMLVTRSDLDTSLVKWYPVAERLVNVFSDHAHLALGGAGPSTATQGRFGGAGNVTAGPGFVYTGVSSLGQRLIVADLTPLHAASGPADPFSGHHSDIYHDEIYQLLAGFMFR